MQNGTYTARSVAELYLKRIAALDKNGPAINAVIEINPDALFIADYMDLERKANKVRGPLHGIPVLIKDLLLSTSGYGGLPSYYSAHGNSF